MTSMPTPLNSAPINAGPLAASLAGRFGAPVNLEITYVTVVSESVTAAP